MITPPHEYAVSRNLFYPRAYFIYGTVVNVRRNGGLTPLNVSFDSPHYFHLRGFFSWWPFSPAVPSTPSCLYCNFSGHPKLSPQCFWLNWFQRLFQVQDGPRKYRKGRWHWEVPFRKMTSNTWGRCSV